MHDPFRTLETKQATKDFDSIQGNDSLEELVKFQIKSRWIAIVGDYNAGKTFFSV